MFTQEFTTAIAGQWRFASSKLKTIWAKQHGRDSAVPPATLPATGPSVGEEEAGAEQQARAAGLALAGSDRGPVDASGKAVLLKSAEELSAAFWKDSRQGRDLLRQVCAVTLAEWTAFPWWHGAAGRWSCASASVSADLVAGWLAGWLAENSRFSVIKVFLCSHRWRRERSCALQTTTRVAWSRSDTPWESLTL